MKKGFTLLEILIGITIISIVVILVAAGFSKLHKSNNLDSSSHIILSQINEARAKSIASEGASQYGIHFNATSSTLFKGTTFNFGNSDNDEILLPPTIEISDITLSGGGADVIFKRLTGETDEYGTITLREKTDSANKMIDIKECGISDVN